LYDPKGEAKTPTTVENDLDCKRDCFDSFTRSALIVDHLLINNNAINITSFV